MSIKDSGNRTEFESGAVRDMREGKGRCDLLPLDVVAKFAFPMSSIAFKLIGEFQNSGNVDRLVNVLEWFAESFFEDNYTMILEVAKHFEEGAKKYGERNWQKGIPVCRYIDSAVRHLLKFMRGDDDEPHDRAFCWNILCAIWTCEYLPHLNDYAVKDGGPGD